MFGLTNPASYEKINSSEDRLCSTIQSTIQYLVEVQKAFVKNLTESVHSPGSEFKNFYNILLRLYDSNFGSEEFEVLLSSLPDISEDSKTKLIKKYHQNLVNMKKNQLQESLKKLEKAFGENSKNLHSNIANSLNSTIKDLDEATLRKLTYTQDTILEFSDSVEYANGLIEKGTTNSLINILMDNPKRVDNFGISIEDLKSLKTIIDIIDRIKQRFGEEKNQDQFVQIIEEISELQKNFKQSNPEKSLGDYIKLIKNISKNENTQKSIIKLIEDNQNILKDSLALLSNMFTNTEVKFSPENSSQLEVTIYVKEGQEKKDGKQVYNSQQFDDEYHKITQAESFLVKKSEEKSKQSAKEQDTNPFGSESESQEIKCKSFFIAHKLIKEIEKITGKINARGWFEKLIDATKFNREILDENKQFVQESDSGILISIKNLEGQKNINRYRQSLR